MPSGPDNGENSLSDRCPLCVEPVDKHHPSTWKQVKGWVGGPRKDSMRLREDTGMYAHDHCVARLQSGQAIDQPDMFEDYEDYQPGAPPARPHSREVEDVELPDILGDHT